MNTNKQHKEDFITLMVEEGTKSYSLSIESKNNIKGLNSFDKYILNSAKDSSYSDIINQRIANHTGINKSTLCKILSNSEYVVSEDVVLLVIIAYKVSFQIAEDILNSAGYSLKTHKKRDTILRLCFINGIYDLDYINKTLVEHDCQPIHYHQKGKL